MTKYAVIYTTLSVEASNKVRPQHVAFLKGMIERGRVVDGMKFPDYYDGCIQGVLVAEASSKQEVAEWFSKDPVITSGARTFEVREYDRGMVGQEVKAASAGS